LGGPKCESKGGGVGLLRGGADALRQRLADEPWEGPRRGREPCKRTEKLFHSLYKKKKNSQNQTLLSRRDGPSSRREDCHNAA